MKQVSVLCSDPSHPVNPWLERWAAAMSPLARVRIVRDVAELPGGDFLFLVSCHQIVRRPARDAYRHSLVLHASALPEGRGMSPHVWQILEGRDSLTVTLLDAEDEVDSGAIWHQISFPVPRTDLAAEINRRLFEAEIELMTWALDHCDVEQPRPQEGIPSLYRRRTPADSEIDPNRPLADYFDLLRVADPDRFPAFFLHRGQKYRVRIDKL
jgi:methionyl-tRNA formyltransferase